MREYYGQHGEDAVLWALFDRDAAKNPQEKGYFVEIGALDGIRFSNTYSFEKAGWRGLCVEAHRDYFDLLVANRPGSTCIHAAASSHDEAEVSFYANDRGAMSTLDASKEDFFRENYGKHFSGFTVQQVPMKTATHLLEEAGAPQQIDVASIDVEGHEIEVLTGWDFAKFQPRVLVIEALDSEMEQKIDRFMQGTGYRKARHLVPNIFYCRDEKDLAVIREASNNVPCVRVPHPRDPAGTQMEIRTPGNRDKTAQGKNPVHTAQALVNKLLGKNKNRRKARDAAPPGKKLMADAGQRYKTHEVGFHGDAYLLQLVDYLAMRSKAFIETGSNVGSTTRYIAAKYPRLQVFSCEGDDTAFKIATERLQPYPHASVTNKLSPQFLYDLFEQHPQLKHQRNLYWLDAHGYGFNWPLVDECGWITTQCATGFLMVDDFLVPGRPQFAFDQSNDQVCAMPTIEPALARDRTYTVVYPAYNDRTSPHHQLTGVVLIVWGDDSFKLPDNLASRFSVSTLTR